MFTLPAGVITDRVDRRKAMVAMDLCRFALTLAVAFAVLGKQGDLPDPGDARRGHRHADRPLPDRAAGDVAARHGGGAARQLGADDPARTSSTRASSRRPTAGCGAPKSIANQFIGPPLGSLLLAVAFALPFFLDAASFFVAAALVFLIPGTFRPDGHETRETQAMARRARRGLPLAVGTQPACGRWRSSSGS